MTEMYCRTVLEAETMGRIISFCGLSPWLVAGHLLPVSSSGLPSVFTFPLKGAPVILHWAHPRDPILNLAL